METWRRFCGRLRSFWSWAHQDVQAKECASAFKVAAKNCQARLKHAWKSHRTPATRITRVTQGDSND